MMSDILPLDVALISVSEPNARGTCSFGVSSDFTVSMAKSTLIVIAEMNRQMPWVYGNNSIQIDEINDHWAAEMVEERGLTEGNLLKFDRCRTQRRRLDMENTKPAQKEKSRIRPSGQTYVEPKDLLGGHERVREAAKRDSQIQFTSLFHHITVDLLRESYRKFNPYPATRNPQRAESFKFQISLLSFFVKGEAQR